MAQMIYHKSEKVSSVWEKDYIDYFKNLMESKEEITNEQLAFLRLGYEVAITPMVIIYDYKTKQRPSNKWCSILTFRAVVKDTAQAIVSIFPALANFLEKANAYVSHVKGGCSDGQCPFVSANYIAPEFKKIKILAQSISEMANQEQIGKESFIHTILQEAIQVIIKAQESFETKTGFEAKAIENERISLFYAYVQASVLFTFALKELYTNRQL